LKIKYKAATIMFLFGIGIVTLLSLGYENYGQKIVIDKEMQNIQNISKAVSLHLESQLKAKTTIAKTLSSAPLIRDALLKSNSEFTSLPDNERKHEINKRNQQWMKTADINAPFIQARMNNPVAEYLKYQERIIPGEYGEIFLTNRYGVMIATTGKLTTLFHAQKYWWLACYNDGQGRIFLDDRGFDTSVHGYVLGVVIPIKDGNEIIGILKCNLNIMGSLTDVVQEFGLSHPGTIKIVRTGGVIVYEPGVIPLSTRVNDFLVELLSKKASGTRIIAEINGKQLVAFSPVEITIGSKQFGFGGRQESIDHIKGNIGEAWHVFIYIAKEKVIEDAREVTMVIIVVGIIFTFLTAVVSLLLGGWTARPIVELAAAAQNIGEGNFDTRAVVASNDEIASLAKSLNRMAGNIQDTMTSRDELIYEVELRKKAEEEREGHILELKELLEEVKTLSGLLPICSNCKKIRDDKGYWNLIENYIEKHSEASFSHGICPDCSEKLYGNQDWYIKMKKEQKKE